MKRRFLLVLFLTIGFLVFSKELSVSDIAPDFSITTQDGSTFTLSEKTGKPVFLHFWATWCPPCIKELPEMQKLSESLLKSKSNLEFIAICVSDDEKSMSSFMKKNKYTFACGLDESGEIVANKYNIQGIPTSILISTEGKILKMNVGMMTAKDLEAFVKDVK